MGNVADPFGHRPRRLWRKLSVEAPPGLAEAVADLLAGISGSGVEIAPASAAAAGGERERVIGYLVEDRRAAGREARLRRELAALASRAGAGGAVAVRSEPLLEEDWSAGWKKHFRPFRAAPRLVIKPSWEAYEPRPGEGVIEMDPGMAFGTGLHASTRLALGLIEEICAGAAPARALDIGTGTGILAMAAALRGAPAVVAIDVDPDALAAARRNVAINRLSGRISVGGRDLAAVPGGFDLVAANITADVLLALAPQVVERLAPGGVLVLAGLLAGEQAREVRAAYERLGLLGALERVEGEWAALLLVRPAGGEIFEIVDEAGRAVGRAPRELCHRTPSLVHRVSHVIVTDARGRIYLQKRPLTKDIQPGKWDTSVGGHLDCGESHEAGAAREMREELGLAGPLSFLHRYLWRTGRETEMVETFAHRAAAEPRPLPGEIAAGRWFTLREAAALVARGQATPNFAEELRRLTEGAAVDKAARRDEYSRKARGVPADSGEGAGHGDSQIHQRRGGRAMIGYSGHIEKETLKNKYFRRVLFTGKHAQLVVMSLKPGEEIGNEVHRKVDQFFRLEQGEATFVFNGKEKRKVRDADAVVVPAGTFHNVINTSKTETLKLYTIYSPPNHPPGTVHKTKAEAEAAEH